MKNDVYKSIGNKTRIKILACLGDSDKTVTELISNCKLSQSAVSQHLAYLRAEGLIDYHCEGKYKRYRSENKKLSKICKELVTLFPEKI